MERKKLIDVTNKKLRLLVTTDCPNHCPLCCNNRFDFDKLPIVDRWDYDEIMITGGEPLLFAPSIGRLVDSIRGIQGAMGIKPSKIYVYTAKALRLLEVLPYLSGVVYTPHSKRDLEEFICMNEDLRLRYNYKNLSLRLNLFPDIKAMLSENVDLSLWQVKDIKWVKDCPVPEGEDFRRIAKLWEM